MGDTLQIELDFFKNCVTKNEQIRTQIRAHKYINITVKTPDAT